MSGAPSDKALGIRAGRIIPAARLGLEGPNAAHAERYEPSPPDALDDMLLDLDVEPECTTFTDLGCGKGRVLCHAARRPFAKVVGVELSRALADEAEQNLRRLDPAQRRARDVTVLHRDAAHHRFEPGPRVVYLFNPFRPPVLRAVLANLSAAVATDGAPTWILYFEPRHEAVLRAHPGVEGLSGASRWTTFRLRALGSG